MVNFFINCTKMGFLLFIKHHPDIRSRGMAWLVFYFLLKWTSVLLVIIFLAQEILKGNRDIFIYIIAASTGLPGAIFGVFFFLYNPNFKFKQELKMSLKELKEYAASTHETVENFLDVCAVFVGIHFHYFSKATKELLVSMSFKGVAQSIFLFGFVAPQFLSDLIDDNFFQSYPTNIRNNVIVNSMILVVGFCHGVVLGGLTLYYMLANDEVNFYGIATVCFCFLYFLFSSLWFFRQLFYFKNCKKAISSYITWLYSPREIRMNRMLVNMYFVIPGEDPNLNNAAGN